jgi:hypothetical protein
MALLTFMEGNSTMAAGRRRGALMAMARRAVTDCVKALGAVAAPSTNGTGRAISPAMASRDLSVPGARRAAWLNSLFVDHALLRLGWRNWGVVESGRLYRSNHPMPWQLEQAARRHGIRTVINLRGHREACGSDALGRFAATELGLEHIDAPLEIARSPAQGPRAAARRHLRAHDRTRADPLQIRRGPHRPLPRASGCWPRGGRWNRRSASFRCASAM